eukprot:m51a1_g3173 putative long-chain-fatty-acid--CoA ligase (1104) ;mRNA; r:397509-401681
MPTPAALLLLAQLAAASYYLHITDPHIDLDYREGSVVNCLTRKGKSSAHPCCHGDADGNPGAGACPPLPPAFPRPGLTTALIAALAQAHPDPDFIVFTGDTTAHGDISSPSWETTVLRCWDIVLRSLRAHWPSAPVYPAVGNHDTYPQGTMSDGLPNAFLDSTAALWKSYGLRPANETAARSYGYYEAALPVGRVRVASLNCLWNDDHNKKVDGSDPAGQNAWLDGVVARAQAAGERVWVVGHMAPDVATRSFADFWEKLHTKYPGVVSKAFWGHTHLDQVMLTRPSLDAAPTCVSYVAPAATPYKDIWPSVRAVYYDPATMTDLDWIQYHVNVTRANAERRVTLEEFYRAARAFGVKDLSLESWQIAAKNIRENEAYAADYARRHTTRGDAPLGSCGRNCRRGLYCAFAYSSPGLVEQYEHAVDVTHGPGYLDITAAPGYLPVSKTFKAADLSSATLYTEILLKSVRENAERRCLGWRPQAKNGTFGDYEWMTYAELGARVAALGTALAGLGLRPRDSLAVLSINCPQWHLADLAAVRQGLVTVPLYPTFGMPALAYIVRQSRAAAAVVSAELLPMLVEACARAARDGGAGGVALRRAVVFSAAPGWSLGDAQRAGAAAAAGLELLAWDDVVRAAGEGPLAPATPAGADDVWSVVYTSGTTGDPKGAVLTHRNAVCATDALLQGRGLGSEVIPVREEVHMSFLPLAHVFERQFSLSMLRAGASIGYYCGQLPRLFDDIQLLRPTFLAGVPRVWKRLRDKVMQSVDNGSVLKRALFYWAYNAKAGYEERTSWMLLPWDRILFSRMAARIGGRCRQIVSGGAAGSGELSQWLSRCFLLHVYNGYGMTETCGGVSIHQPPYSCYRHPSSIGHPVYGATIRLVDSPELGYSTTSEPPAGEMCLYSPQVFGGYLDDDARTAEVTMVTDDGRRWIRTGDIGRLNDDGSVTVIDRVKNMFKLAQGEYVAAEQIEMLFSRSPLISQIFIHGESTESFVVAIAVPEEPELLRVAREKLGVEGSFAEVCGRQEVVDYVLGEMTAMAREAKMPGFQVPKALLLEHDAFTSENNMLSPTFKLRRPQLRTKYAEQLKQLYVKGRMATQASTSVPN